MTITKSDVLWSYAAQFFNVATGIIVLPAILRLLNTNEIAFYYIILNIGTLVNLFDFGFSTQFSRNFAYVFSGAQELKTEGLSDNVQGVINFKLLKILISTASTVYRVISIIVLTVLLTLGTWYVKKVTGDFSLINNSLYIWLMYSISVFFNMYFMYLNQMVMGRGLIKRNQQAIVASRLVYLVIAFVLLKMHFGLFSIVIANFCAPFVSRFILIISFYSKDLKEKLKLETFSRNEKKQCFDAIWYNAKKLGVVTLGTFGIQKSSMFFAGLFLTATEIASFGLLQQVTSIALSLSVTLFNSFVPRISSHCVEKKKDLFYKDFSICIGAFYISYVFLASCVIFVGPFALKVLGANVALPIIPFCIIYFLIQLLEQNHSLFATIFAINNKIPYVAPSLISGAAIVLGLYVSFRFTTAGIWSLLFVPGIVQLAYNNWKWPHVVCKDYINESYLIFSSKSIYNVIRYFYGTICKYIRKEK